MSSKIEFVMPSHTMTPVEPYSHIAKVDHATGNLAGRDVGSQTKQILDTFDVMLTSVGPDLDNVIHINVFLANKQDLARMTTAYVELVGNRRPAPNAIAVSGLQSRVLC